MLASSTTVWVLAGKPAIVLLPLVLLLVAGAWVTAVVLDRRRRQGSNGRRVETKDIASQLRHRVEEHPTKKGGARDKRPFDGDAR